VRISRGNTSALPMVDSIHPAELQLKMSVHVVGRY
jgi:hypothetical protein